MFKIVGADGREYGPVAAETLRQWISEGRVNASTSVQAEGATHWQPLSSFPEFGLPAAPTAPSPPPAVPAAVKVFGILNLVFGSLGLLCSPFSLFAMKQAPHIYGNQPLMRAWLPISVGLGLVGGTVLLASGVGLCRRRVWGRKLAVYYAIFALVVGIFSSVLTVAALFGNSALAGPERIGGLVGGVFGFIVNLAYNGLLIFFLTRKPVVDALEDLNS
jgi:energy-converting hydrogenase Eha subunit A